MRLWARWNMRSVQMLLVIVALEEELSRQPLPAGVVLVHSGVGKVNAALATAAALREHAPTQVVNFGTAGALSAAAHGLVEVGRVLQRDMLAMPLAPRGVTPFDARAAELGNGRGGLLCASGDSFVSGSVVGGAGSGPGRHGAVGHRHGLRARSLPLAGL
jgi:adenosylhomocysteine nucleosidase